MGPLVFFRIKPRCHEDSKAIAYSRASGHHNHHLWNNTLAGEHYEAGTFPD